MLALLINESAAAGTNHSGQNLFDRTRTTPPLQKDRTSDLYRICGPLRKSAA